MPSLGPTDSWKPRRSSVTVVRASGQPVGSAASASVHTAAVTMSAFVG